VPHPSDGAPGLRGGNLDHGHRCALGTAKDGALLTRPDSARVQLLYVTPRYAPFVGGIETHVSEVGRRVAACGYDVTVLTVDPRGALPEREVRPAETILRVGSTGGDLYWSPDLYRTVANGQWDLVHCQGIHTLVPVLGMLAASRRRVPYLVTFHTGGHDSEVRMRLRWLQWMTLAPLLRGATDLIAVSRFEAALWHRVPGLKRRPISIIPNGAGMPVPDPLPVPDRNLVVSVGRLVRYKGHQRAIAALAELVKSRPAARLRIVGSGGYESSLHRLADQMGVADRVEIQGIPGDDRVGMARLLASAGVVLLMSEYEAHPVAVMEAASLGRPVIAADTTGLTELIERRLARGVPLAAAAGVLADAIAEQLDAPAPDRVPLPCWDTCADALVARYRTVLSMVR
jgi:glycogen synthase